MSAIDSFNSATNSENCEELLFYSLTYSERSYDSIDPLRFFFRLSRIPAHLS
jgi:hypothetical protein